MSAHLLVIYPRPTQPADFDRRYREEHLPYAGSRLQSQGATKVTTQKVLQGNDGMYWISDVLFPTAEALQACAASKEGQEAMAHATSISSGGKPQFVVVVDS